MSGHKHAELMLEYAKDAAKTDKPWKLWEGKHDSCDNWETLGSNPSWSKSFEYRRKPVKWEPVGGEWWVIDVGHINKAPSIPNARNFGLERPTKEQAERAAVEMRRFNRLLALRDELCGDDEMSWIANTHKYIHYDHEDKKYRFSSNKILQFMGVVYFPTNESAQRACDMLNSGEVIL